LTGLLVLPAVNAIRPALDQSMYITVCFLAGLCP
jgi:hypothetical protein